MAFTLNFSDTTDTVLLGKSGNTGAYLIQGSWSPQVAIRRTGFIGRTSYIDPLERMSIIVRGVNGADARAKLQTLVELFDRAGRWGAREVIDAVSISYLPEGSMLATPVSAVIYIQESDGNAIELPGDFEESEHYGGVIRAVNLKFRRQALWLGATESSSSSASTGNPAQMYTTPALTDIPTMPWPYTAKVTFNGGADSGTPDAQEIFAIFQSETNKQSVGEADVAYTLGTGVTSTVVSGSGGGSVARCTSATGITKTIKDLVNTYDSNLRTYVSYLMVENRSASAVNWDCTMEVVSWTHSEISRIVRVPPATKTIIKLGPVTLPDELNDGVIWSFTPDVTGSSPGDDFDVDWIVIAGIDEFTSIFQLIGDDAIATARIHDDVFNYDARLDSHRDPIVYQATSGSPTFPTDYPAYSGNFPLMLAGQEVDAIVFGGLGDNDNWVIEDPAGTELNMDLDIIVTKVYLIPV